MKKCLLLLEITCQRIILQSLLPTTLFRNNEIDSKRCSYEEMVGGKEGSSLINTLSPKKKKKKIAICTKQIYYYYSIKQSQFFFYFFFYFELNNLNFPFIFSFILNLFLATLNYIKSYVCFYILKIFLKKNIFFSF